MEKVGESWRGGVPLPGRIPFGGKGALPEKRGPSRSRNPFASFLDLFSPPFGFFYVRGPNANAKRKSEPKNY